MKKVHVRAIKTLLSTYRYYYILVFLKGICTQSIPYVSLLGSAMILEAVTDQQYAQAGKIVMGYLVLLFLLKIGEAYVSPLVDIQRQMGFTDVQQAPYQKMLRLNFHVSDQAETKEALFRIERDMYQTGTSLLAFFEDLATTIPHMVGVVWGVGLFIPIFFYTPTIENGRFFVSPWMVLILLVVSVLGMMGVQALGRHAYQFFVQNFQSQTELRVINNIYYYFYTRLNDSEMGKEIRMYEGAKKIIPHLHAQQAFIAKFLSKYEALNGVQLVFSQIVIRLLTWGIYAIIAINVMTGALALRFLVQLTGVIPLMMHNLTSLFTLQALFVDTETLDYYFGFMDQEEAVRVGSIPVEKRLDHHYPLAVTDLHFSYPGQNREILQGITETFEVGKKYAIVGENGSGKTTFMKCLMRLYEPTKGSITLNGIDLQKYNVNEIYHLFGVVFQDFRLLDFTIKENIAVNTVYDADKGQEILHSLQMTEWIKRLPKGLDTYLGQRYEVSGVNVSGGQEQKIALARAIYKDASIMILDEPTAALDPIAELEVYEQFDALVDGRTAFYISHRLSSCRFCDEILVFDNGKIIQRGSHDQLVTQAGKYQDLWQAQASLY